MPKDADGWKEALDEAFLALTKASNRLATRANNMTHRRGTFPSLAHGLSFGGGQMVNFSKWPVFRANSILGASVS